MAVELVEAGVLTPAKLVMRHVRGPARCWACRRQFGVERTADVTVIDPKQPGSAIHAVSFQGAQHTLWRRAMRGRRTDCGSDGWCFPRRSSLPENKTALTPALLALEDGTIYRAWFCSAAT